MIKLLYRLLSPKFKTVFFDYAGEQSPRSPHSRLRDVLGSNVENYQFLLHKFLSYKTLIQQIQPCNAEKSADQPCWNNGFLPGLDIIALYCLLDILKPKKYIEIGSGNSTKVAFKSIQDHHLDTEIISIDPNPRTEIDRLAHQVIRQRFETISDYTFIKDLKENDVLFIDNSHRILPNSDATVLFLEILPELQPGVIVHIHDIYIPYDYPQFMCDRFYSEQYGLAIFLLANSRRYQPLLPNYYIHCQKHLSNIILPIWDHPNLNGVERHGGSFWMKIG